MDGDVNRSKVKDENTKWYSIMPWWAWLIAAVIASLVSQQLGTGIFAAGFGFFVLFSLIAMVLDLGSKLLSRKAK